ncbi:MAG: hypothetical protein SVV67_10565 [Bacillota bacterium]|nr:hypothetical protein [Bacillota bacterium]
MNIFRNSNESNDSRVLENKIRTQQKLIEEYYKNFEKMYPDKEPHDYLAEIWLSRSASYGLDPHTTESQIAAYSFTADFACMPIINGIKALAFYIFYKENESLIEDDINIQRALSETQVNKEFEKLMKPVYEAHDNETWFDLYSKYNPNHAKEMNENV